MRKYLIVMLLFHLLSSAESQEPGSGNTLLFDGTSNRIVHDALFNSTTVPVSISYWIKLTNTPQRIERVINTCWTPDLVYYGLSSHYIDGNINVSYGDGRGPLHPSFRRTKSGDAEAIDSWFNVTVVVRGPTDMSLYYNGVDIGGSYSGNGLNMAVTENCQTIIGYGVDNNGTQFLNGQLDELRVWDYALTEAEVREYMCRKLVGNESGLVGYWRFDEGAGNLAFEAVTSKEGVIDGAATWITSGAPIGDVSYYEYFPAGTKSIMYRNGQDSFLITTEAEDWIGFHIYEVSQSPNSTQGSTLDLTNGYYGIFPIFLNGNKSDYKVEALIGCGAMEYRNANDDPNWKQASLTLLGKSITSNDVVEFVFENIGILNPIGNASLCPGSSIEIDASSDCATDYSWSTGDTQPTISLHEPGMYWVDRTTSDGIVRDEFTIDLIYVEQEIISEEEMIVCDSDFPLEIESILDESIFWSNGESTPSVLIDAPGVYWAEYQSECGLVRDSITIQKYKLNEILIPNVITPNNDGLNDCFIVDDQLIGKELVVFNRTGISVYKTGSYFNDWCPENLPMGIYYYQIIDACSVTKFKGYFTVLK